MKHTKPLAITLSIISILTFTPFVRASTVTEAIAMIALLRTQTESVAFSGQHAERDRAFLLGKLEAASISVDQAKFCKAIKNLRDFDEHVEKINRQGQIDSDGPHGVTVHDMHDTMGWAEDIIQHLIGQGGITCPQPLS